MFELLLTSCILHRRLCQVLKSNHKSQTGATRCFRRKPVIDRSFWELLHFGNVSIDAETQPQNPGADSRLFSPSHEGNLLSPWDQTKSTIMCLCVCIKNMAVCGKIKQRFCTTAGKILFFGDSVWRRVTECIIQHLGATSGGFLGIHH